MDVCLDFNTHSSRHAWKIQWKMEFLTKKNWQPPPPSDGEPWHGPRYARLCCGLFRNDGKWDICQWEEVFFIVQYSIGTLIRLVWFICKKNCRTGSPSLFATGWPILTSFDHLHDHICKICYIGSPSLQEAGLIKWSRSYIQTNCGTQPSSLQYINRLDYSFDPYRMKVICSNGRSSLKGPDYQSNPNKLPYYFILFATSFTIQMIRIRCNQLSCRTVFFATDLTILLIQIIICKK